MAKQTFTLEGAQQGKELVTRGGRSARYVAMLSKSNPEFPLVVEVLQSAPTVKVNDQVWHMENYSVNGMHTPPHESALDLFINSL